MEIRVIVDGQPADPKLVEDAAKAWHFQREYEDLKFRYERFQEEVLRMKAEWEETTKLIVEREQQLRERAGQVVELRERLRESESRLAIAQGSIQQERNTALNVQRSLDKADSKAGKVSSVASFTASRLRWAAQLFVQPSKMAVYLVELAKALEEAPTHEGTLELPGAPPMVGVRIEEKRKR